MLRPMMNVLWPSFLVAIVAEGCFFSTFDPFQLLNSGDESELQPIAAYTIGFFFFWISCALASMLTHYLSAVTDNRHPQG
jgi:hypothetical protein